MVAKENKRLQKSILDGRATQLFVPEGDSVPDGSAAARFGEDAKIILSKKRTFEAAAQYARGGDNVCVLNFASSTNPGGGVAKGSSAQEESLCRISTLYFMLDTDENMKRFYNPHRKARNPLHNDDILYTRGVTVFKTDTQSPKLLDESEWYDCDVITCAAPSLRNKPSNIYNISDGDEKTSVTDAELAEIHMRRDSRIFDVAAENGADVLVLGAFGCGAFRNNPDVVAKVMVSLAKKYARSFKAIEFAVFCRGFDDENYSAFESEFGRQGIGC